MQIEVLNDLEQIKALKHKWDDLFSRAQPGMFSHHTWVYENLRCFDTDNIILIAVFGDKQKLIGTFPFAVRPFKIKKIPFRALMHGGSSATDYSQFIIDPAVNSRQVIKLVLDKLVELQPGRWDIFKIDNLSDGDETSKLFMSMMLDTLYAGTAATDVTPALRYSHGHRKTKKIAKIKRQFKKILDDSTVIHKSGCDITDELLQEFSRMHQISYPDSGFDSERAQSFYKALIKDPGINHCVYLSYIEHEQKMIAAHFGFMDTDTFYYYVPAYDPQFATYGPGQYLLWQLIVFADEKNLAEFDFLRGAEEYKFSWTNKINTNYTVLGVTGNAGFFHKLMVNLWLITKGTPFFK